MSNPVFDPLQRKMVSGPEAGQNVEVDGFEVSFIGASTSGVYNAGSGLTLSGNVFAANVANVGFGLELAGGTASYARYRTIETVSGGTVTLMAGHAYKAYATTSPLTITAETIPANMYGQEGHLKVFVGPTGYVIADPQKVVLTEALEPDSVNNLTVRFHDGYAILSVEDHVAGYIVFSATGSTAGTLPYALSSANQEYVAFDAILNGSSLDMGGATTNGEKHVVGNGYAETILTGCVSCTSKTTFANLAMSAAAVTGGTMTLGDVYIPQGGTVSVNGGGLAVEKVTGNGGTIDLKQKTVYVINSVANINGCEIVNGAGDSGGAIRAQVVPGGSASVVTVNSCTITGCYASYAGGAVFAYNAGASATLNSVTLSGCYAQFGGAVFGNGGAKITLNSCSFVGCSSAEGGGVCLYNASTKATLSSCTISGCSATTGAGTGAAMGATYAAIEIKDCIIDGNIPSSKAVYLGGGSLAIAGSNVLTDAVYGTSGTVTISSGAIVDLTGNTNATAIAPGGGITFGASVTVINSAGTSVSLNGGEAGTCNVINNDGTTA